MPRVAAGAWGKEGAWTYPKGSPIDHIHYPCGVPLVNGASGRTWAVVPAA
jgi:hypothetical protein